MLESMTSEKELEGKKLGSETFNSIMLQISGTLSALFTGFQMAILTSMEVSTAQMVFSLSSQYLRQVTSPQPITTQ